MNETIAEYLAFLWEQFQYDWSWMSNPWVLYAVIPEVLYCIFFICKWTVLLAPITVPIMIWKWSPQKQTEQPKKEYYINN